MNGLARPFVMRPRDPVTGKQIRIVGRTRAEVESRVQKLHQLKQDIRLGFVTPLEVEQKRRAIQSARVTLREALESYCTLERIAEKTRINARGLINPGKLWRGRIIPGVLFPIADERLDALTPPRLAKHFRALSDRNCWGTVEKAFHTLNAVARHAAEEGWIVHKPWGLWKPTKPTHPRRAPTREACRNAGERAALVAQLEDPAMAVRWKRSDAQPHAARAFAIVVGLFTGARHGELAGLRWGDVTFNEDDDRATVRIERQWEGGPLKWGERRIVECAELGAFLRHYFHAAGRPGKSEPLFPDTHGDFHSRDFVCTATLQRAAARAQLGDPKRWNAQSLRDSFITIEAQACGGDLRRFMERTGHRSPDSAWRYLHSYERAPRTNAAAVALPAPRDP